MPWRQIRFLDGVEKLANSLKHLEVGANPIQARVFKANGKNPLVPRTDPSAAAESAVGDLSFSRTTRCDVRFWTRFSGLKNSES